MLRADNHLWRVAMPLIGSAVCATMLYGQGLYISSSGPTNRSMGGASSAAPIDALGATYWNPAAIGGLDSSELAFGFELISSNHRVSSAIDGLAGSTDAQNGVFPVPAIAWVHHTGNPRVVFGMGLSGVAGVKTNLSADPGNPVLMPGPAGLGRVSSEASFFQVAPMISIALSHSLAAGVGPVVTLGQVAAEPFVFASPNANGRYSPGRATRYRWGSGAQVGLYYASRSFRLGGSVKTPTWMETFQFSGEDAAGAPRALELDLNLPAIASFGMAYVRSTGSLLSICATSTTSTPMA